MKVIRIATLIVAVGAAGSSLAQGDREISGIQAAPLNMLDDAQRQFQLGNLQESAKDLRSAAALMLVEARRFDAAESASLKAGSAGLEILANRIDGKEIKTVDQFNQAAVSVVLSKAKAHQANAVKAWSALQRARAGEEILAAAHALEHGLRWTDGVVAKGASDLVARVEAVSAQLTAGKAVGESEMPGLIETVGVQIEDLSKRTTSRKASH